MLFKLKPKVQKTDPTSWQNPLINFPDLNKDKTETSGCYGCTVDDEIAVLNTPFITFIGLLEKYGINEKSTFG